MNTPIKRLSSLFVLVVFLAVGGQAQARTAPESFADLAEKLLPAVVNISTTQTVEGRGPEMPQLPQGSPFEDFFREFFERNRPQQRERKATSLGSGFIIDSKGLVVTNNHVIQDADEISVILHDDTRLDAEVIGRDPKTDLAVLRVKSSSPLPSVTWGDSDRMRVGDWVVAIGNPFGLGGTVTAGIVSARGRDINSGPYDDYIQTDASINKGNSGGPMFDLDGRVVGVNTAIYSPSGGSVGIGFAIPSRGAKPVVEQLIKHGEVRRGWLGVHIQHVTDEIAESLGLSEPGGALVASVAKDGPAEKAKVQPGDVILTFDGKQVTEMRKLPRIVADTEVGKAVPVEVWRQGKKRTLKVTIGRLDDDDVEVAAATPKDEPKGKKEREVAALGITVAGMSDEIRERFSLEDDARGVVVTEVRAEGPAAEKGVRPGDVITEVSHQSVRSPNQLSKLVEDTKGAGRKNVLLMIEGQSGARFVAVRIGEG